MQTYSYYPDYISVTPLDVVKTRLQTQQRNMLSNKCYLYCNGLMDHLCPCTPEEVAAMKKQQFTGTIVNLQIILSSTKELKDSIKFFRMPSAK